MLDKLLKNWKTSFAGIILLALTVQYTMGHLDTQSFLIAAGFVLSGGLFVSKDFNISGK